MPHMFYHYLHSELAAFQMVSSWWNGSVFLCDALMCAMTQQMTEASLPDAQAAGCVLWCNLDACDEQDA